jgi:hypothetical protein
MCPNKKSHRGYPYCCRPKTKPAKDVFKCGTCGKMRLTAHEHKMGFQCYACVDRAVGLCL